MRTPLAMNTLAEAVSVVRSASAPTPLVKEPLVDGREVFLKREDLGPTRSFKWRGSLTACHEIAATGARGVVTASTGNHGASVAWAASLINLEAHVVVPERSSETKCELIMKEGAVLHRVGASVIDADGHAQDLARKLDLAYFEDGGRLSQVLGAATLGLELTTASELDSVVIPVGCGALAAGIGLAMSGMPRRPRLVGVQSTQYARLAHAFVDREYAGTGGSTLADGLADDRLIEPASSLCLRALDDMVLVDDVSIVEAIRRLWQTAGIAVEGAGAAALAALNLHPHRIPGSRVASIVSGANIDPRLFESVLERRSGRDGESPHG